MRRLTQVDAMRAKSPHPGAVLVALQCGMWIALAPVMPQLHQASASHRHVFCLEHNRIEDDGLKQNDVLAWRVEFWDEVWPTCTATPAASTMSWRFRARPEPCVQAASADA